MRITSRNWKAARLARMASPVAAFLLMLIVAGCGTDPKTLTPLNRDLPEYPAGFAAETPAPPLQGDARAVLAQTRTALAEANAQKACGAEWYEAVRDFYRGVRAEEPSADGIECLTEKLPAEPAPMQRPRKERKGKR